ncbi:MAG: hypothetical protein RIS54_1570 [Verrucomicrobiota bacterium]|jgi:hypothetical protein
MPFPSGRFHFVLVAFVAIATAFRLQAETDPWRSAQNLDFNGAAGALASLHAAHLGDGRITCAYAASLLVRDPVTAANVTMAQALLESVAAVPPGEDQSHRPLALYLLGRIAHEHVEPARFDVAAQRYEQLRREYPSHPLADEAAVQLAFLRAFDQPPENAAGAIAAVESLLAGVQSLSSRRELHFLLATLHWHSRHDAAAALPHYLASRELGFETPYRDGEVDLTIAGLAVELGRDALAAQHYLAFAEASPRDARAQTARRLAAEATAHAEGGRP